MEDTDSEKKWFGTVGYQMPANGAPIKGWDMQGIGLWLGRQVQFCDERTVS